MCKIAGVSRSGYYNYVKNLTTSKYLLKEEKDKEDFEYIIQAYKFKNRHKGARAIKMTLERQYGIIMNLKKIRRLMHKFNLKCPIRKANPYRRMAKALKTNNYHDNKINREFYNGNPGEKLLTDITYIFYGPNRNVAYLSTIKDSVTTEIFLKFLKYSDPVYSPQTAYFYRLKDFFSLDLLGEGFIVTGYTKDLKKQVEISKLVEEKPVLQIGFKAFENAPMESFTFISKSDYLPLPGIIHPYAFSNCENLSMIKSDCRVLSMGISNCSKLEEIYNITPTTDCSLYNLPSLIRIKDCDPRPIESQMGDRYTGLAIRATSGLRKSSIYLCPNLSVLTGTMLSKRNNVIFYGSQFPYYT